MREGIEIVQATGLGKRYAGADAWALQEANLDIRSGDVFGLVGENGAGKSTLIRMLLGFLRPSAGHIYFAKGVKVGYVAELPTFWPTLTVREQLCAVGLCAGISGKRLAEAVDRMLQLADLTGKQNARTNELSRGMLQRLSIAQATLPEPQFLVLDEPTAGLDPAGQRDIRNLIRALHREGTTVLISSHYLVELEEVCTRIGVLHEGKKVLDAAMAELVQSNRHRVQIDLNREPEGLAEDLLELGLSFQIEGSRVTVQNLDDERYFLLLAKLHERQLRILALGHPGRLLEQILLATAGRAEA